MCESSGNWPRLSLRGRPPSVAAGKSRGRRAARPADKRKKPPLRAERPLDRPRTRSEERSAFLNVPYDRRYENLFLAFIAGLRGFGLTPRATIEITGSRRRLERITALVQTCQFSFHDLSRVEIDRTPPATPRFNMPFELGLAVALASYRPRDHEWFVFEANAHRLKKSLSDLDGTDPLYSRRRCIRRFAFARKRTVKGTEPTQPGRARTDLR